MNHIIQKMHTLFSLLSLLILDNVLCNQIAQIPACKDFVGFTENIGITIPGSRTSGIAYNTQENPHTSIKFQLTKDIQLKCNYLHSDVIEVLLNEKGKSIAKHAPRNFWEEESGTSSNHRESYFTKSGHFYDHKSSIFYRPDGDYCVHSYSETAITLRICTITNNCKKSGLPNTWCVPKCCAIDEVLLYWRKQCVKLTETEGSTPWIPPLFKSANKPKTQISKALVSKHFLFQMKQLPKNCPMITIDAEGRKALFRDSTASHVPHPNNANLSRHKDPVKLVQPLGGKSGVIQPIGFNLERRRWWLPENIGDFCVDGFFFKPRDSSEVYTGNEQNFVVFYCGVEKQQSSTWITYTYIVVSIVALLFLSSTIAVYIALLKHHNLHGLLVLSYMLATFGSYLFLTIAHVYSLLPSEFGMMLGLNNRGLVCYINAVLAHYCFLASYTWLTALNFDMWLTFRRLRVVRRDFKEYSKFAWYSAVGWGLPMVLVGSFIGVNESYRDPYSEVPVPGYAEFSCFVSSHFRGQYLYTPMGIMLGANMVLIIMTMQKFVKMRSVAEKTFQNQAENKYNARLFLKLFIVMGGTSVVDFVTWYYNNRGNKHWIFVVLENISYLTPIALFVIFCFTDRVIIQLKENYPGFMGVVEPYLSKLNITKSSDSNNSGVNTDDTRKTGSAANTPETNGSSENVPLNKL